MSSCLGLSNGMVNWETIFAGFVDKRTIRSERNKASSILWVTNKIVFHVLPIWKATIFACQNVLIHPSAEKGSSRQITG